MISTTTIRVCAACWPLVFGNFSGCRFCIGSFTRSAFPSRLMLGIARGASARSLGNTLPVPPPVAASNRAIPPAPALLLLISCQLGGWRRREQSWPRCSGPVWHLLVLMPGLDNLPGHDRTCMMSLDCRLVHSARYWIDRVDLLKTRSSTVPAFKAYAIACSSVIARPAFHAAAKASSPS